MKGMHNHINKSLGKMTVKAESPSDSNNDVQMKLSAKVETKKGCIPWFRTPDDVFLLVERARNQPTEQQMPEGGILMNPNYDCKDLDMIPVVKTKVQYNQLEPEFNFTKKMVVFCNGNKKCILKFTIKKAG